MFNPEKHNKFKARIRNDNEMRQTRIKYELELIYMSVTFPQLGTL